MNDTNLLVQVLKAVHELLKEIAHQRLRKSFIYFYQAIKFAILCEIHDIVANRSSAFNYFGFDIFLRAVTIPAHSFQSVLFCKQA